MKLMKLLATDNYTIYNKTIAKRIGVECAILLGTLCSLQNSFKQEEFFRNEEDLSEDTCLSIYTIRKCKQELNKLGILEITKKGLPAKHYFKINEDKVLELITNDNELETTSSDEIVTTSNNEINITSDNDFIITNYNKQNNKQDNKQKNVIIINNKEEEVEPQDTLYDYLQNNGFVLSPIHYEEVSTWEDTELTRYAIKEAVLKNIYTIKYISTVLNAYKQNNIKTVKQAQEHEARRTQSFNQKPQQKKKDYRDVLDEWLAEKQAEDERRLANDLSRSY